MGVASESNIAAALGALQLQEARWQSILASARDAIVSIDEQGLITLFNRGAEDIFGYSAREVVGANVAMLMPSPYHDQHDGYLRNYRTSGEARAIGQIREVAGRRKGGEVFPIELSVSEARVGDQVIYSAIIRDVTEQHRMRDLLERRANQQAVVADLGMLAFAQDAETLMQRAVELVATTLELPLCKILEIQPDGETALLRAGVGWDQGIVGRASVPLGAGESQAGYTLSCGDPIVFEEATERRFARAPLLAAHGAVSGASTPIHGSGVAFGVLGVHGRIPREFSSDDVRFLQAVANIVAGAVDRDRASRYLAIEHAVTRELAGASSLTHAAPRVLALLGRLGWEVGEIWRLDRTAAVLRREALWQAETLDAAALEPAIRMATLPLDAGIVARACREQRVCWTAEASTDRGLQDATSACAKGHRMAIAVPIRSNQEMHGALVLLAARVRPPEEPMIDLLDAVGSCIGDYVSRKRAEDLAERNGRLAEMGVLTAKIVHDVGNPIAGLSMLASRIQRRIQRDPGAALTTLREPVDQLDETIHRLDSLIQGFKNFARVQRLDLREVTVSRFVGDVVTDWEPEATARGITLVFEPDDAVGNVLADAEKLRRVFDNLLKNALEAIDHGPGRVRVATRTPKVGMVRISIEDDGPGVPVGVTPFELFATTKAQGTGLGLSIAKQIMLAHGGGIELTQAAPHGAVFHVELPIGRRQSAGHGS